MKAAIYSRKSRFTGKGESVENQIQMCREHGIKFLGCTEDDFMIYEDEGFSGGNTDRPQFQRMLRDAKNKLFDMIICYRLDRISRNVSDFSQLIGELEKYGVSFVSVREQFDTTKPMGRAMMYIASVFSQLERETIAERIRDNMLQLAKTGRWLGGIAPTGYRSEMVLTRDSSGKEYRLFKLVPVPEEAGIVKLIYHKYVSCKSLAQVEKYLVQNRIFTKNGLDFGRFSIRFILTNPVYAIADGNLYRYLQANGYEIYSEFDEFNGSNGLIGYNKTRQSSPSDRNRSPGEWVLAVGLHPGLVPGRVWIEAQELLRKNKSKAYRKVKSTQALLSGLIRCAGCGSFMRPKTTKRLNSDGTAVFYYICELKEKSKNSRCSMKNANGNVLEQMVVNELLNIFKRHPPVIEKSCIEAVSTFQFQDGMKIETSLLQDRLTGTEAKIKNLVRVLSEEDDINIQAAVLEQLRKLNEDKEIYAGRLKVLLTERDAAWGDQPEAELPPDGISADNPALWMAMTTAEKRRFLKSVIDRLVWNDGRLEVFLRY